MKCINYKNLIRTLILLAASTLQAADPNEKLVQAAAQGHLCAAISALEAGASIYYNNDRTLLLWNAERLMYSSVNYIGDASLAPLICAAAHGHKDTVEWILSLEAFENRNYMCENAIRLASLNGQVETMELILTHVANLNSSYLRYILIENIELTHVDATRLLINAPIPNLLQFNKPITNLQLTSAPLLNTLWLAMTQAINNQLGSFAFARLTPEQSLRLLVPWWKNDEDSGVLPGILFEDTYSDGVLTRKQKQIKEIVLAALAREAEEQACPSIIINVAPEGPETDGLTEVARVLNVDS
jgi:hypothetical protein